MLSRIASRTRGVKRCHKIVGLGVLLACALLTQTPTAAPQATQKQPASTSDKVRAERYEIDVAFEPERGFLRAKASVTLRAGEYTEAIEFELNPGLVIQEVTDSQGRKLAFDRSRRLGSPKLSVRLAEPCGADQGVTLTFAYQGVPRLGGLDYITKDGILLRDESRWYPAVELAAFTQNHITVTLPRGWNAVAGGKLVEHPEAETHAVLGWKTERPVSSRALAAGSPTHWKCNVPPGGPVHRPSAMRRFLYGCFAPTRWQPGCCSHSLLEAATRIFDSRVWPYGRPRPTEAESRAALLTVAAASPDAAAPGDFTIVEGFPGQRGAIGYSAPGFLVVSEDMVKWQGAPGYAPEFLPHEMAHQWFPIEVALERQEDGWLAESLAEYLAWRYLQETSPADARVMVARAMRDALAHEPLRPIGPGLRLFALDEWDVTYATLYQRGMLVWRTLETVIGRQRVDAALREYYRRFAGRSASIAGFRKICEEISERDLGWFFDYFLDDTSVPEIELRRLPPGAPGEVLGEIVVRNAPPEFQTRVEMRIHTTAGPLDHSVATRGEVTPFSASVTGQVTGITLDPDARILRWTDAARRHRRQRDLLANLGELEDGKEFARVLEASQQALAADPENLAVNHQQIRFARGRLYYRLGQSARAMQEFARVLELNSLDRPSTDFYRAWARVYRARIERQHGNPAAARAEAKAGLAIHAPALETEVAWPETPQRKTSAAQELRALAK